MEVISVVRTPWEYEKERVISPKE